MRKRLIYLILPIITLILEILPYGAVCNFLRPSVDGSSVANFRELYSYFHLTPFGYANFAPLITAVMSCLVLLLLVIYWINGNIRVAVKVNKLLYIVVVVSLCPLLLGIKYFSFVAGLITLSLAAELLLLRNVINNN